MAEYRGEPAQGAHCQDAHHTHQGGEGPLDYISSRNFYHASPLHPLHPEAPPYPPFLPPPPPPLPIPLFSFFSPQPFPSPSQFLLGQVMQVLPVLLSGRAVDGRGRNKSQYAGDEGYLLNWDCPLVIPSLSAHSPSRGQLRRGPRFMWSDQARYCLLLSPKARYNINAASLATSSLTPPPSLHRSALALFSS
jgi:hypothetical protein